MTMITTVKEREREKVGTTMMTTVTARVREKEKVVVTTMAMIIPEKAEVVEKVV